MKCVKCGAELKEGCMYCSVCGKESQLVPDYSVLEDDYLRSILNEEEKTETKKIPLKEKHEKPKKKMDSRLPIFVVCILLVICISAGIAVKVIIAYKNANSYEYQVNAAKQEMLDKNYDNALLYYKTALSLKPEDVPVRMLMAELYIGQKAYDDALVLLTEVIAMQPSNVDAYKNLLHIYETKKEYDNITELASDITNAEVLALFEDYLVTAPIISPNGGEYEEAVDVTLFSMDGFDIYYTLDGSEPDAKNGIYYEEDADIILDKNGRYKLRAVCVNDKGICSEIADMVYRIALKAPAFATVYPDGGRFDEERTVTIMAKKDCAVYYTWDGTDPSELSAQYTEPLEIPEGNHILSVLVVDEKTGLDSGVYRTNFIYYPE